MSNAVALIETQITQLRENMDGIQALMLQLNENREYDRAKFYGSKFSSMMGEFAKLMQEFTRTEYDYETYTGPQLVDRYKSFVSKDWKHKSDKDSGDAEVPLSDEEIKIKMLEFGTRKEEFSQRRVAYMALEASKQKALEARGSTKQTEDDMLARMLKNDPNPTQGTTTAIMDDRVAIDKAKALAATKARLQLKAKIEEEDDAEALAAEVAEQKRLRRIEVAKNIADTDAEFGNYSLDQLDDLHSMQKDMLEGDGSDLEDDFQSRLHIAKQEKAKKLKQRLKKTSS